MLQETLHFIKLQVQQAGEQAIGFGSGKGLGVAKGGGGQGAGGGGVCDWFAWTET